MSNDKAVAVVRDVLERLDSLSLKRGSYMSVKGYTAKSFIDFNSDLKDYLTVIQQKCTVCQLGACLLSKARLFDQVPMSYLRKDSRHLIDGTGIRYLLADVFDEKTLDLMEAAFECESYEWFKAAYPQDVARAIHFGKRFATLRERVEAIMLNVIDNGGRFVPPIPAQGV